MPSAADVLGGAARGSTFGVLGAWYGAMRALGSGPGGLRISWRDATPGQRRFIEGIAARRGYGVTPQGTLFQFGAQGMASPGQAPGPAPGGTYRTTVFSRTPQSDWERILGRDVGGKPTRAKPKRKIRVTTAADKLGRKAWTMRKALKWLLGAAFVAPWLRKGAGRVMRGPLPAVVLTGAILADSVLSRVWGVDPEVTTPPISPTPRAPARAPTSPGTSPRPNNPAPTALPGGAQPAPTVESGPSPVTWLPPVPKPAPEPWYKRWMAAAQPYLPLILPFLLPSSGAKKQPAPITNISVGQAPSWAPLTGFEPRGVGLPQPGGQKKCECGPKRKRKPKERRRVCYRGTYIETPTGLQKRRGKRVSCQRSRKRRP